MLAFLASMKAIVTRARDRRSFYIGAILTTLAGALFLTPLGQPLVLLSYELPFIFRPHTEITNVLILYMDDESHRKLNQPWDYAWDRSIHARAIDQLGALGARAIVFDVLFDKAGPNDDALVRAAQRHTNVFFAANVEAENHNGRSVGRIVPPFTNVFRWGVVETSTAEKFVPQHYRDAADNPSLAWVAAEATMPQPPRDIQKERWLNYYGKPGFLPHHSYSRLFSNSIPATEISNKVVFIGAKYGIGFTGGRRTDDYSTPFTPWSGTQSPGVEVVATSYLNFWRGDWLRRWPLPVEFVLLLVFGSLFGAGLAACPPMRAAMIAVAGFVAIAGAAVWLMWNEGAWFPWLAVGVVQLPVALFWSILTNTKRVYRENETLAKQLATTEGPSSPASEGVRYSPGGTRLIATEAAPVIPDHTLIRKIGKGAYGEVWLARDIIGSYHAVKVLYENRFTDTQPFDREFHGIEKFTPISRSHPGLVHILHVGRNEQGGYFYCIMELGDDQTKGQKVDSDTYVARNLRAELDRRGRLTLDECVEIALKLCSALDHLHQHRLLHRDIKPANIIFVNGVPKFADVGLVTEFGEVTGDVSLVGTPDYIPPEGPGLPTADIYGFGKVLYQLYTGLPPRKFPELPTALVNGSEASPRLFMLNRIIVRACEDDVSKRYQSAAAMHSDLLEVHKQASEP